MKPESSIRKVRMYTDLLKAERFCNTVKVKNIEYCPCGYKTEDTPPPLSDFIPFKAESRWGDGPDCHAWFHLVIEPSEQMRQSPVWLRVFTDYNDWAATNPQFILYVNGEHRQGLDVNHKYAYLGCGERYDIYLYAYTAPRIENALLFVEYCNCNEEADALWYDLNTALSAVDCMDERSGEYAATLEYLDRAVSLLDLYEIPSEAFFASVKRASEYLRREYYGGFCGKQREKVVCIGHTHIDCAWLWTLRQSREKVQRSFATACELMRLYPDFKFMSSQGLLYKYLKEEAPEVYSQVKQYVKEGRWEIEGSMWVEADCNLSSGESLIRQLVYGKRFFKEEFGVDTRVLWLPDVFGYSAALPQILRKCGVEWFVTSKLGWNDTNRIPHDVFEWKGIDGTPIRTYFLTGYEYKRGQPPTVTPRYNSELTPSYVKGAWHRFNDKKLSDEVLLTYGYGDGGGGPTAWQIENGKRLEAGMPGMPSVSFEFAGEFLSRLDKKLDAAARVSEWSGELYLEFHRATYTTQSANKRNNRKSEFMYMNAEQMSTSAKLLAGAEYPKKKLLEGWELILTNQFHDIIPGSSIREVYEQSDIDYAEVKRIGGECIRDAAEALASRIDKARGCLVYNPNSFEASGFVRVGGKLAFAENIPALGYSCRNGFKTSHNIKYASDHVETPFFKVGFDESMHIVSLYDKKNGREVIAEGKRANEFRVYPDYPDCFDAWEWNEYSLDEYTPVDSLVSYDFKDDGASLCLNIERRFAGSVIRQSIRFYEDTDRIDFETSAKWASRHQMLKVAFPVDINSSFATYDIQFGSVERPTHKNTSWDRAMYETCAHKYADLSEGGYGVSLLNDCKYGYDIHGGTIMLSLLRTPTYPDPEADSGEVVFTYALYPHKGAFSEAETIKQAYLLNNPLSVTELTGEKDDIPAEFSLVSIDRGNIICETVKEAEEGGETVFRFYESNNSKTRARVSFGVNVTRASLCDMNENELCELDIRDNGIELDFRAFDILTVKVS